jgi:hypothetical protein
MRDTHRVTIEVRSQKYEMYVQADQEIQRRLGKSPGIPFLMSLIVENEEDPIDLADNCCATIFHSSELLTAAR